MIAELDSIIFDIDGVLIDVDESIQMAHQQAAALYFGALGWRNCESMVEPSDVDAFKLAGGFNSDWDAAYAWLLLYLFKSGRYASQDGEVLKSASPTIAEFTAELAKRGGGLESAVEAMRERCSAEEWANLEARWDRSGLQRLFIESYSGDLCSEVYGFEAKTVTGPGLILRDKPILEPRFLPDSIKLGIATGRTAGETTVGLTLMGWSDLFPAEAIVSEDDGFKKPDPGIMKLAVERLGARRPMFIGDTPDDLLAVRRFNETCRRDAGGTMLACMVLTGLGWAAKDGFIAEQADMIADNVNAALAAVSQCIGGALCPAEKQR